MQQEPIWHATRALDWTAARKAGEYRGSPDDLRDGFIHFSTRATLAASLAKHRSREEGLVLLEVDPKALGEALKWEPARGGVLFPHLYGALPFDSVRSETPLPLDEEGRHILPDQARA